MLPLFLLLTATSALGCEPRAVQNLAVSAGSSQLRLAWAPPGCARGYRVCSATEDSRRCASLQTPHLAGYSLGGLRACTRYRVSVETLGDGDVASSPVHVDASTAPGPLSGLGAVRGDDATLVVLWNYEVPAGGGCASQFLVSLCEQQAANCSDTRVGAGGSHYSLALPLQRQCRPYLLAVVALDERQQASDNTTLVGEPAVMGGPENLTVTNLTSSSFDLQWAIPESQAGCEYVVYVDSLYWFGIVSYGTTTVYDGGRTRHSVTNITSCTACNVSVSFRTGANTKMAVSTIVYTLPEGSKVLDNATVRDETSSAVAVAWSTLQNDECVGAYRVCWGRSTAAEECRNSTARGKFLIAGLRSDTQYQVSVSALLRDGAVFDSVTVQASTKSGAAALRHGSLVSIATVTICLLRLSI